MWTAPLASRFHGVGVPVGAIAASRLRDAPPMVLKSPSRWSVPSGAGATARTVLFTAGDQPVTAPPVPIAATRSRGCPLTAVNEPPAKIAFPSRASASMAPLAAGLNGSTSPLGSIAASRPRTLSPIEHARLGEQECAAADGPDLAASRGKRSEVGHEFRVRRGGVDAESARHQQHVGSQSGVADRAIGMDHRAARGPDRSLRPGHAIDRVKGVPQFVPGRDVVREVENARGSEDVEALDALEHDDRNGSNTHARALARGGRGVNDT